MTPLTADALARALAKESTAILALGPGHDVTAIAERVLAGLGEVALTGAPAPASPDLDELDAIDAAMTPGPWITTAAEGDDAAWIRTEDVGIDDHGLFGGPDARGIVAMRNSHAAIRAELRAARGEVERLRRVREQFADAHERVVALTIDADARIAALESERDGLVNGTLATSDLDALRLRVDPGSYDLLLTGKGAVFAQFDSDAGDENDHRRAFLAALAELRVARAEVERLRACQSGQALKIDAHERHVVRLDDRIVARDERIAALESALRAVLDAEGGSPEESDAFAAAHRLLDARPAMSSSAQGRAVPDGRRRGPRCRRCGLLLSTHGHGDVDGHAFEADALDAAPAMEPHARRGSGRRVRPVRASTGVRPVTP